MNTSEFMDIVRNRLITCEYILQPKGEEYSRHGDRLHNFKVAAEISKDVPEGALFGMWLKHVVSILDIIEDLKDGKLPEEKVLDEKVTDSINYLLLFEALVRERAGYE